MAATWQSCGENKTQLDLSQVDLCRRLGIRPVSSCNNPLVNTGGTFAGMSGGKSNPHLFHIKNLQCAKPVKNNFFFVRKACIDSNLCQVEKKFAKTGLISLVVAQ